MDDVILRVAVALGVVVGALLIARLSRSIQQPTHPPVDLSQTSLPNGVVVFTSSECANCAEARRALKTIGAEFREVTWELEPGLIEEVGVQSVPLIVVRGDDGRTLGQIAGKPGLRRLRSLVGAGSGSSVADS